MKYKKNNKFALLPNILNLSLNNNSFKYFMSEFESKKCKAKSFKNKNIFNAIINTQRNSHTHTFMTNSGFN